MDLDALPQNDKGSYAPTRWILSQDQETLGVQRTLSGSQVSDSSYVGFRVYRVKDPIRYLGFG